MPLTLRRATIDDVGLIGHHRDSMFRDMGIAEVISAASAPARVWLAQPLTDGRYVGVLAQDEGVVVGGVRVLWLDLPPNIHRRCRDAATCSTWPSSRPTGGAVSPGPRGRALFVCRASGVDARLPRVGRRAPLYEALSSSTNEMRITLPWGVRLPGDRAMISRRGLP